MRAASISMTCPGPDTMRDMAARWAEVALVVLALIALVACTRGGSPSSSRPVTSTLPAGTVPSAGSTTPTLLGTLVPPGAPAGCEAAAELAHSGEAPWRDSLSLLIRARTLAGDTSNPLAADSELRSLVPTARELGRRLQADGQAYARIGQQADEAPARDVAAVEQALGSALAAVDRIDDLAVVAETTDPGGAPSPEVVARIDAARAAVAQWAASACGLQLGAAVPGPVTGGR